MIRRAYRVIDPAGLHARPAADVVQAMAEVPGATRIEHGAKAANAKSILQVLGLGVRQHDQVVLDFGEGTADDVSRVEARIVSILSPAGDFDETPSV